jgi:hypothetical protein
MARPWAGLGKTLFLRRHKRIQGKGFWKVCNNYLILNFIIIYFIVFVYFIVFHF